MESQAKKAANVMDLVAANEKHWKLVGIELALTSGVRTACAHVGIMQGKGTPKALREFCVDELGEDTFGLVYDVSEREELPGDAGKHLRAYIALEALFGKDWMKRAAEAYFTERGWGQPAQRAEAAVTKATQALQEFRRREQDTVTRWLKREARYQAALAQAFRGVA